MPQPRQYFERQIRSLDEIIRWLKDSPDKKIAGVYALIAKDRLDELHRNNVEIDYKFYEQKINPYLK